VRTVSGYPVGELDEAERAFYSTPPPWEVVEYGMTLVDYVCWYWKRARPGRVLLRAPRVRPRLVLTGSLW